MRRTRLATAVVAVAVAAATTGVVPARARSDKVDRVLVLSLPTLAWDDLADADTPNLDRLLAGSAVGAMSVGGVSRATSPGDGYTTIGAGTRSRGSRPVDGLAFEGGPGAEAEGVFELRTGRPAGDGLFSLAIVNVLKRNAELDYDAEVGALGGALDRAGVHRAVLANADGRPGVLRREAVEGLMDATGRVPAGAVEDRLLMPDAEAAFGRRLDPAAVADAFRTVWRERAVVLVEASDLVRAVDHASLTASGRDEVLARRALEHTDALVGRLLEEVDLGTDAVIAVGPYHAPGRVRLTVAGLHAPGVEPGYLRSASTRRDRFVTLVDVAPTVLDLLGVERPPSMEGSPITATGEVDTAADRVESLVDADRAAAFRDRMVTPVTVLFIAFGILLAIVAAAAEAFRWPRLRRPTGLAALAVLAFLPITYLAGLFPFHRLGGSAYWLFLVAGAVLGAGLASVVGRRRPLDAVIVSLLAVFAVLVVDLVLGARLQLNTAYGYSPTVGGRFAGLGNLAFAQLAAAAVLLSGLLAHRIGGRRGVAAGVGVLVVALVVDGMPFWGADVGGVLSLVPAAGLTISLLLGWRLRGRAVVMWLTAAAATLALFAAADLARPEESRTHLGRLVARVGENGPAAFQTVAVRKLGANLDVLTSSVWALAVPLMFVFAAMVAWRAPGRLRQVQVEKPQLQAALAGLGVAATLGFALNDSGIAVPGVMLGVANASMVYLMVRTT